MLRAEPEMKERLAEEIEKLGWTNQDIADELLCTATSVASWRRGEFFPGICHLRDLYEIGCDIMYIITGEVTRK